MANPHVYNAVRDSMAILGSFYAQVAEEVGRERATEMYGKYAEGFGERIAGIIHEHRDEPYAAQKVASGLREMMEGFGIDAKLDVGLTMIRVETPNCPIYDGLRAAGLDHEVVESMCTAASSCEAAALQRVFPEAEISLPHFRNGPDDTCIEEIRLG